MLAAHYNKFGGIAEAKVSEIEKPTASSLKEGQLLVRVRAASLNILDLRLVKGELKLMLNTSLPSVFGFDFSGVVEAAQNSSFTVGDEVFGMVKNCKQGSLAEYLVVDDEFCALKPTSKSHEEAAAIPLAGFTALMAFEKSHLEKRQKPESLKILVLGGSGGVGTLAVQLAKHLYNATFVAATTSAGSKAELAKALGADVVLDYHEKDIEAQLQQHGPFDVIFHAAGDVRMAVPLVKTGGSVVSVAAAPNADGIKEWLDSFESKALYNRRLYSVVSSSVGKGLMNRASGYNSIARRLAKQSATYHPIIANGSKSRAKTLAEEFSAGRLQGIIDKKFPLEEATKGLNYLDDGHASGKVIVTVT